MSGVTRVSVGPRKRALPGCIRHSSPLQQVVAQRKRFPVMVLVLQKEGVIVLKNTSTRHLAHSRCSTREQVLIGVLPPHGAVSWAHVKSFQNFFLHPS